MKNYLRAILLLGTLLMISNGCSKEPDQLDNTSWAMVQDSYVRPEACSRLTWITSAGESVGPWHFFKNSDTLFLELPSQQSDSQKFAPSVQYSYNQLPLTFTWTSTLKDPGDLTPAAETDVVNDITIDWVQDGQIHAIWDYHAVRDLPPLDCKYSVAINGRQLP